MAKWKRAKNKSRRGKSKRKTRRTRRNTGGVQTLL